MFLFRQRRRLVEGVYLGSTELGIPIAEPFAYKVEGDIVLLTPDEISLTFLLFEYLMNIGKKCSNSNSLPTYTIKRGKMEKIKNKMFDENTCVVGIKVQVV